MSAKRQKDGRSKNTTIERPTEIKSLQELPASSSHRGIIIGICFFLAAITWSVFGQTVRFGFINCDDPAYVYENPLVTAGLTLKGMAAAFVHVGPHSWDWVPLTTISHMVDWQCYGRDAGGHHLTNVLLHTAAVILLFLALRQLTGAVWRSAFVAAMFAIHPLHVESVAWVAERKDVLSGVFFMLTLLAYARYVRRRTVAGYLTVMVVFALGLLSKAMLVTMPLVLLLLDYWPLNRLPTTVAEAGTDGWFKNFSAPVRLLVEKIPLLALSLISGVLTILALGPTDPAMRGISLSLRVENALVSCTTYLGQMLYPAKLAAFYPYPAGGLPLWKIIGAFGVLAAATVGIFLWRRKRPYLVVGWLWYLGMLAPTLGFFQAGTQGRADRFTYLPQIGMYLLVAWLAVELFAGRRNRRAALGGLAAIIVGTLMVLARHQTSFWQDSESLWTRTLAVTPDNSFVENTLGFALLENGQTDGAMFHFQKALAINPDNADACNNLGSIFAQKGQLDEAMVYFQKALEIKPAFDEAHNNLGHALLQKGQTDAAIVQFQRALESNPGSADAYNNLGTALIRKGQTDAAIVQFHKALEADPNYAIACGNLGSLLLQEGRLDAAIVQFQKELEINPNSADARNNLGTALLKKGRGDDAIAQYQKALAAQPGNVTFQNNLAHVAWLLATSPDPSIRNGTRAVELAQQADQSSGGSNLMTAAALAAAYAEAGRFPDAVVTARRALQLAASQNNAAAVAALQTQLKLYQTGSPFHDTGATP